MSEKLKECPFCGGTDIDEIRFIEGWGLVCQNKDCNCRVGKVFNDNVTALQTRASAITAWNTRAADENPPLTLDELQGMYRQPIWI